MAYKTDSRTRILIILILAVIAGLVYLLSILPAYSVFQSTRLADPLAELNSLFPLYYVAIGLTALSGVGCLIWRIENKYLHLLLLSLFAVMLWFTPYCLAGYVRLPDGPWHVGVAMQIPQVLDGDPVAFSGNAWLHPGSYIYHYAFLNTLGMEPTTYISLLFPLFCLLIFILLCYVFIAKFISHQVAFLSMLIAIPGLHYIQLHPSPHTIGALLMLTTLLLLIRRGIASKVIAIMAIIAIIISHPTTPLLLSIFLAAALLTNLLYSRRIGRTQVALASILLVCFVGWLLWRSFYHASPPAEATGFQLLYEGADPGATGFQFLYEGATQGDFGVAKQYLTGTTFIYGSIHNLNKVIYFLYAIAAIAGILYVMARTYLEKSGIRDWISRIGGLKPSEAVMAFSIPFLLILTFLLAARAACLIETGLTFIILALSCIIASVIARSDHFGVNRRIICSVVVIGLLFLTLSFPAVAYSIDAYSSFPKSEEAGLKFLATSVPLGEKTISTNSGAQLALYLQSPIEGLERVDHTRRIKPDLTKINPDIVVFRSTGYYLVAMRHDLSFEDNRFAEYLSFVESNKYDRIYSSSTFEVYSNDKAEQ